MTFSTCVKLITLKKERLTGENLILFISDMENKLDVFLLNNRLTDEEYSELINMLK